MVIERETVGVAKAEFRHSEDIEWEVKRGLRILIAGRSGSGKTRLGRGLGQVLSIQKIFEGGQEFRGKTGMGASGVEYGERSLQVDREIDNNQKKYFRLAKTDPNPGIVESRLSGVLASEILVTDPSLPLVRILLTAPAETRFRRMLKRIKDELGEDITEEQKLELNLRAIKRKERERERRDLATWRKVHKILAGIDPFDPRNKDSKGNPIYDIVISTATQSKEQTLEIALKELEARGWIKRRENHSIPKTADIFLPEDKGYVEASINGADVKTQARREDFGPGTAGTMAFFAVASGFPCQTYIDGDKNICGNSPIGTVDVDIRDDVDTFTYCSKEHGSQLKDQLVKELESMGRYTVPGRNGFGRA